MPLELNLDWADRAACAGTPHDWWFPVTAAGLAADDHVPVQARALCDTCPVRVDCHRHALHHEPYGVWAALSEKQRHRLRRAAGIRHDATNRWTDPVAVARAVDLHKRGTPPPQIGEDLGVTRRTVYRYLAAGGVELPESNYGRRQPVDEHQEANGDR
jgi:WhiB family redox-sensing transcriptional regulator